MVFLLNMIIAYSIHLYKFFYFRFNKKKYVERIKYWIRFY